MQVATALCNHVNEFIQWPRGETAIEIKEEFRQFAHFPGVIGVVDGCHIQISAPHENPESYINRHGYHSVILQGICDSRMRFTDVYAGYCGSTHDATVFHRSEINRESDLHYEDYFPNQTHILGDKAYGLNFKLFQIVSNC